MLTITGPIELHSADFTLKNDGFAERIRDNYSVMGSGVSAQSLTHMLNTPPEILVAEGGEEYTGITNNLFVFNEIDETIISNAMNRILLSTDVGLTYQDKVYISNVLNKLGIRDERRFMSEVRTFLEETKNSERLTNFYMENMPELRRIFTSWRETERSEETLREEIGAEREEVNNLYLNILNRLKTGAIYQIINNLNRSIAGDTLNRTELNLSEQSYTARQLLLRQFRTLTTGEQEPLIYKTDNIFEEETREPDVTEEKIRERINSAVLLELIRSVNHAESVRSEKETKSWLDLRESYYRSSENTLSRIIIEAREGRSPVHFTETALTVLKEAEDVELETLREIFTGTVRTVEREESVPVEMAVPMMTESVYENETLEERLERINKQNEKNVERYVEIRKILAQQKERTTRVSDRERTIRESLLTLNDKDHLIKLLEEADTEEPTQLEKTMEKIYSLLPADTVAILKEMEGGGIPDDADEEEEQDLVYTQAPVDADYVERTVNRNAVRIVSNMLYGETDSSILRRYSSLIRREVRDRINRISESERIERIEQGPAEMIVLNMKVNGESETFSPAMMRQTIRDEVVNMVFKTEASLTEEDVLNTLEEYRRNENKTQKTVTEAETVTEVHRVEPSRVIETVTRAPEIERREEIAEMIEQGVKRQLGSISNEVYSRLEKRLKSEKTRRGM